ncbi:Tht1-like nuclear fusion protein-domain-containing protein [Scheffersomyces coipomensis]|uniref:Tht1-like nuclear fusion protein-domain-containing protein n=1 Tax=Scheffersomyces coipomensis TaxID=1788519 RepID=UPI00315D5F5E
MKIQLITIVLFSFIVKVVCDLPDLVGNGLGKTTKNECIKQAISNIIAGCVEEGVDSLDPVSRKISSVKLSICEFKTSGIDYPHSCHGTNIDYDACIFEMKASPQFWTTYSLNYKEIANVCYQESLPYEKDQILSLYANITEVIDKVFHDFKESNEYNEEMQIELKIKFDSLLTAMNELVEEYKSNQQEVKNNFNEYKEDIENSLNNTLVVIKDTYDGIYTDFSEMETYVLFFTTQIRDVKEDFSKVVSDLERFSSEIVENLENTSLESQEYTEKILSNFEQIWESSNENQKLGNKLSLTLKKNQVLENELQSQLYQIDHELLIHNDLLLSEFTRLFLELSNKFNQTLEEQLNVTDSKLADFMNNTMKNFDMKLNRTEEILNGITSKFEDMVATAKIVTGSISDSLSFIKTIPTIFPLYYSRLGCLNFLNNPLIWSIINDYLFSWNTIIPSLLTLTLFCVKNSRKLLIVPQVLNTKIPIKIFNYILIFTLLLLIILFSIIMYRIVQYIDSI